MTFDPLHIDHVLFDLDGTLMDPALGITRGVAHALAGLGLPEQPIEVLRTFIGPPLPAAFRDILGLDADQTARAVTLYREYYSTQGMWENEKFPDIDQVLARLGHRGKRLFVVTSKPHAFARPILEHFGLTVHFEGVYGSELDGTRADKAELVRFVLDDAGLDPARTVMVGDRKHDVQGARANGVASIGVGYGYGSEDELREAGCTVFTSTLEGLEALLEGTGVLGSGSF